MTSSVWLSHFVDHRHQASFRHAVWPDIKQTSLATRIWGRKVHPDWRVQQLMADLVVYYIQRSHARFLKVSGTTTMQMTLCVFVSKA